MRVTADLHIHSRFSRATSPKLRLDYLDRWARIKGLDLVGTGDCTHPEYLAELKEQLETTEGGFYRLKDDNRRAFASGPALRDGLPDPPSAALSGEEPKDPKFAVTGEISTIYSEGGKTRKIHHLVILPSLEAAAVFQERLARIGNITSDGRPILGLSSRELFAILLEADERSILVPAHIWTPWFSALGSRSGYDSIDECYGALASRIGAVETGLSSNPPMNWALSSLDRFAIVSNSDAHSPDKLGREATLYDMDFSYEGLFDALSGASGGPRGQVAGTIEFFPQEGKYHYEGHRACAVVLSPEQSAECRGLCPVCGKPLTPGVLGRVAELADRPIDEYADCPPAGADGNKRPYRSLIPLDELLSELIGSGPASKKVMASYNALIEAAGSELRFLSELDTERIAGLNVGSIPGTLLAEAVLRMRSGRVWIRPGYDGEYGRIRVFAPGTDLSRPREDFFDTDTASTRNGSEDFSATSIPKPAGRTRRRRTGGASNASENKAAELTMRELDPAQIRAASHGGGPALVVAGPGAGKTAVLALRVARLLREGLKPESVLALTFTNKAAAELRARIASSVGADEASRITACTFHSFCLSLLIEKHCEAGLSEAPRVLGADERAELLAQIAASAGSWGRRVTAAKLGTYIESRKHMLLLPGEVIPRLGPGAPRLVAYSDLEDGTFALDPELDEAYAGYRAELRSRNALDFEDLVAGTVRLLSAKKDILDAYRRRFTAILVDEYQDVNFAQYALVRLLYDPDSPSTGAAAPSLFVIGDPNQSIYGFRGSDPRFIERFTDDFPGALVYRLRRSFRCPEPIIEAAGRIASAELTGSGGAVSLYRREYPTAEAEAEGIAREIDRMIGGTRFFALDSGVASGYGETCVGSAGARELKSLGDCAILVRVSALTGPIEKALADHGIPCETVCEPEPKAEPPERSLADLVKPERVRIMTIHASKGLEFDHVFIPALEEGILPFTIYEDEEEDEDASPMRRILEERRVLYVAMTRARRTLSLSWARERLFRGRRLELGPSRFLSELEDIVPLQSDKGLRKKRDPQLRLF
jgi:uncharacterized protein (TIGR00375 family)